MPKQPLSDLHGVSELLLTPTAANLSDVNKRLEDVLWTLAELQKCAEAGEPCGAAVRQAVLDIQTETKRISRLLDGAAHFYNSLESGRQSAVYGANGCVRPHSVRLRTLAQA